MGTLQEEFEYVRKTFFPRWDQKMEWKVADGGMNVDLWAFTKRDEKLIILYNELPNRAAIRSLMIHEICHAMNVPESLEGDDEHGREWQRDMLKAGHRAAELGLDEVAVFVWRDLKGCIERDIETCAKLDLRVTRGGPEAHLSELRAMVQTLDDLIAKASTR